MSYLIELPKYNFLSECPEKERINLMKWIDDTLHKWIKENSDDLSSKEDNYYRINLHTDNGDYYGSLVFQKYEVSFRTSDNSWSIWKIAHNPDYPYLISYHIRDMVETNDQEITNMSSNPNIKNEVCGDNK